MSSERPKDSIFPHVVALVTNPTVRKWLWRALMACATYGIIPATQVLSARLQQIHDDHVALGVLVLHAKQLAHDHDEVARTVEADRVAARQAIVLSTRVLVEYVAGTRHQDVNRVLLDYDDLVKNWQTTSPKCLDPQQCPLPAEAAQRALAARKPR
jgi:hypothetical protein